MFISSKTRISGVIGDPISHSLSPKLHNYLLNKHQIDGIYVPLKITKEDLEFCLKSFAKAGIAGCNITIPHKESVFKICDYLSKTALATKAVNTIIITEDKKLFGYNSDGDGFVNNVKTHYSDFNFSSKKIVVLGAGGAARSICFALMKEKVTKITLINRSIPRAENLAEDLKKIYPDFHFEISTWEESKKNLSDCDLLINTTSLGMMGQEELEIDISALKKEALVSDIVYKPLMTKLLSTAKKQGNPIVTGIGMLIHQGLIGFEAWFKQKPEVDEKLINQMIDWSSN